MQSRYRSAFSSAVNSSMTGPTKRHLSSSTTASAEKKRKIVVIGAGFVGKGRIEISLCDRLMICSSLGSYIAKALISDSRNTVVLASRNPEKCKFCGVGIMPIELNIIFGYSVLLPQASRQPASTARTSRHHKTLDNPSRNPGRRRRHLLGRDPHRYRTAIHRSAGEGRSKCRTGCERCRCQAGSYG
jgi:hypothetical protein